MDWPAFCGFENAKNVDILLEAEPEVSGEGVCGLGVWGPLTLWQYKSGRKCIQSIFKFVFIIQQGEESYKHDSL